MSARKWTDEEIKIMLEMKKRGCPYAEIGAVINRPVYSIADKVSSLRKQEARKAETIGIAAQIQELINACKTDKEIPKELGISESVYRNIKNLHGIHRTSQQKAAIWRKANETRLSNGWDDKKTICWTCKNSMVNCKKPVKGWKAKKIPYKSAKGEDLPCWLVKKCPNYDPEPYASRSESK